MGEMNDYIIDLGLLNPGTHEYDFHLGDEFFTSLEGAEFCQGDVDVHLVLRAMSHAFSLEFKFTGTVKIECDRCLELYDQDVTTDGLLDVKFGPADGEDGGYIVVNEKEPLIDLSWYMYEFLDLSIPISHIHPEGGCNEEMAKTLEKYICHSIDDDDEEEDSAEKETTEKEVKIDPRWEALKNIKIE